MRSGMCSASLHSLHHGIGRANAFHGSYAAMVLLAAAIVLIPGAPLGTITTAVQALAGVLLPSATVFLLLLCNDKAVLGPVMLFVCNQRLVASVGRSLESLRAEGISTMVLKGAAVGAVHYRDAGARPMDDVDVLVRPEDAERALAVLRAGGWSELSRIDVRRVMRSHHALPLANANGGQLDLHWRVLPESVRDDDFWAAAVPTAPGTATTLAPGPTDQLMHTCAHGVKFGAAALRWIADAAAILRSAGGQIDWPRLVDAVAEREVSLRPPTSLELLRDLLGAPIPRHVLAELDHLPSRPRERLLLEPPASRSRRHLGCHVGSVSAACRGRRGRLPVRRLPAVRRRHVPAPLARRDRSTACPARDLADPSKHRRDSQR